MRRVRSTMLCLFVLLAYASGATRALHLRTHHVAESATTAGFEASGLSSSGHSCGHGGGGDHDDSGAPHAPHPDRHSHTADGCGLCECLAAGGLAPSADQLLPNDVVDGLRRAVRVRERVTAAASVRLAGARAPPARA